MKAQAGEAGLKAKPHPGRGCQLSPQDKDQLKQLLLAGPQAAGFDTALWTCPPRQYCRLYRRNRRQSYVLGYFRLFRCGAIISISSFSKSSSSGSLSYALSPIKFASLRAWLRPCSSQNET